MNRRSPQAVSLWDPITEVFENAPVSRVGSRVLVDRVCPSDYADRQRRP